jgi:hypothetical protein
MATEAENLQTAIEGLTAKLATVYANPKPSYSINGQSVSWDAYRASLLSELEKLKALLVQAQGPIEVIGEGF